MEPNGDLTPYLTCGNKTQKSEMTELTHLSEPHFFALFIENPISQKRNCSASFPIPRFMDLSVISICSNIGRQILGIYKSLTDT
jgi:hypothetical protein